jgi:hypothetical protein
MEDDGWWREKLRCGEARAMSAFYMTRVVRGGQSEKGSGREQRSFNAVLICFTWGLRRSGNGWQGGNGDIIHNM